MKLAVLLLSFLACVALDTPMLRSLKRKKPKLVSVCDCKGNSTSFACVGGKYNKTSAEAIILAANGTAFVGKCDDVKFQICKCKSEIKRRNSTSVVVTKCETKKAKGSEIGWLLQKNATTLGACFVNATSSLTNSTDSSDSSDSEDFSNSTSTTNTTNVTRF